MQWVERGCRSSLGRIRLSEELAQLCKAAKGSFHRNCLQGGQRALQQQQGSGSAAPGVFLIYSPAIKEPFLALRDLTPGFFFAQRFGLQRRSRQLSAWVQEVSAKLYKSGLGVSVFA